jgi:hypothetical protein
MSKSTAPLPDWELLLSSTARLQRILPDAVLVGGTAAAIHAGHRSSYDADHVLVDLNERFDEVLAQLESVAGWKTALVRRPVQILGNLDGIETGVRQLIRDRDRFPQDLQAPRRGPPAALGRLFRIVCCGRVRSCCARVRFELSQHRRDSLLSELGSIASARVTALRAPAIPAAMTHPFCGRKPMMPLVRMIEPVDLIRLAAYFAAVTAPQKRTSKNRRALVCG